MSETEVALQELEETIYWMELLAESGIVKAKLLSELMNEANELTVILVTSVKTPQNQEPKVNHHSAFIIPHFSLRSNATIFFLLRT